MNENRILITGATGLLGGAILADALRNRPETAWTALVRAGDEAPARARLAARLARYTDVATGTALAERVDIITGDLFSIANVPAERLALHTQVLHLAADTSYWSKAANWRVNFDGTMAVAEAASRHMPALKRFLHIGTATICGRGAPKLVQEDAYPSANADHIVHYTLAKASTETALAERFPDLPLVITRPSIVAGHSVLGCAPTASILWFVRAAEALRLVSCDPEGGIDIIPFDWAASALLTLLLKPELSHRVYHVSAGAGSRAYWPALARAFAAARGETEARYPDRFSPQEIAIVRQRFREVFGGGDARLALMQKAARKYYEFCALDATFNNTRLLAEGVPPSPPLPSYITACLAQPAGQSILDAFLDDVDMFDPTAVPAAA